MGEAATLDEAGVLMQAQQGDRAAFGALVRAYQRRAYAIAYGFVGNREDALELAQEAFARAYKAMPRFETGRPFYPWLHRIIKNACLNHLKKKRRHRETSLEAMMESGFDVRSSTGDPVHAAALGDLRRAIVTAMQRLSEEHREILILRHFDGMAYAEIAECLEVPKGTVMSRLHTARNKLRKLLAGGP